MSPEKKYTHPRMFRGECVDMLTQKKLPEADCLTKSGKGVPRDMKKGRKVKIEDGKECVWRNKTKYTRHASEVSKEPYTRHGKKIHREGYTRKKYKRCPPKKMECKKSEQITIQKREIEPTEFWVQSKIVTPEPYILKEKKITKEAGWICSKIGEK